MNESRKIWTQTTYDMRIYSNFRLTYLYMFLCFHWFLFCRQTFRFCYKFCQRDDIDSGSHCKTDTNDTTKLIDLENIQHIRCNKHPFKCECVRVLISSSVQGRFTTITQGCLTGLGKSYGYRCAKKVIWTKKNGYRLRLRLRQGLIQHIITHGSFTSGLH